MSRKVAISTPATEMPSASQLSEAARLMAAARNHKASPRHEVHTIGGATPDDTDMYHSPEILPQFSSDLTDHEASTMPEVDASQAVPGSSSRVPGYVPVVICAVALVAAVALIVWLLW